MQIPKQLILQLTQLSDEKLIQFFNTNAEILGFPESRYEEIIEKVLTANIKDEAFDTRPVFATIKKSSRDRRVRWIRLITQRLSNKDIQITNKKHPFHYLEEQRNALLPAQFLQLYGTTSIDEIIEKTLEELHAWQQKQDYFIMFPLLFQARKDEIYPNFLVDVITDCLNILISNYDGRVSQFLKQRPELLLDTPIFSDIPFRFEFSVNDEGKKTAEIVTKPGTLTVAINGKDITEPYKTMDTYDEVILSSLISFAAGDFYDSGSIVISASDLAKAIASGSSSTLGGNTYKLLSKRLHKMAEITYRYQTPLKTSTFTLLDRVTEDDTNGKKLFKIDFGAALFDAIVKQKTISVTRDNFDQLESSMARLLYPAMQRERINLSRLNKTVSGSDARLKGQYTHLFFSKTILFDPSKRGATAKAMKSVVSALAEFRDKKIAVESFEMIDKYTIQIYFYPLSDAEKYDFDALDEKSSLLLEE